MATFLTVSPAETSAGNESVQQERSHSPFAGEISGKDKKKNDHILDTDCRKIQVKSSEFLCA